MDSKAPFFDGTYWDYCLHIAPDCFHVFPDEMVDVDFDTLNEKRNILEWRCMEDERSYYVEYISLEAVNILLESALDPDILTEYTVRLENDELERLRTCRLVMDEAPDRFDQHVKDPCYRMRGRSVTEEQAFDVIRRTDSHIRSLFYGSHPHQVVMYRGHFQNDWTDPRSRWRHGWMHPNGIVGKNGNGSPDRLRTFLTLLEELLGYQKAFPFLDLAAAISCQDLDPEDQIRSLDRGSVIELAKIGWDLRGFPKFFDTVAYGIRLDGNTIEFLRKDRALETYQEYETLYGAPDSSIYTQGCQTELKTGAFDAASYLQRCIASFDQENDRT